MTVLRRLIDAPSNILLVIACFATILMMLHVVADIAGKLLLNAPVKGTIEIVSFYYMVAGVFCPLAYIARKRTHIVVEIFTNRLPAPKLAALNGIVGIVGFAFMFVLAWMTIEEAISRAKAGEVWETGYEPLVIWPSRWILAIGCAAMTLYLIVGVIEDFRAAGRGNPSN